MLRVLKEEMEPASQGEDNSSSARNDASHLAAYFASLKKFLPALAGRVAVTAEALVA
jgi:hypothetical protein